MEKNYQDNELTLSDSVLVKPKKQSVNVITSRLIQENAPPELAEILPKKEEGGWETFIFKKSKRMINMVLALDATRRKNSPNSQIIPERPLSYRGQFLYPKAYKKTNQASSSKPRRPRKRIHGSRNLLHKR